MHKTIKTELKPVSVLLNWILPKSFHYYYY